MDTTVSTPLEKEIRNLAESYLQSGFRIKHYKKDMIECAPCNIYSSTVSLKGEVHEDGYDEDFCETYYFNDEKIWKIILDYANIEIEILKFDDYHDSCCVNIAICLFSAGSIEKIFKSVENIDSKNILDFIDDSPDFNSILIKICDHYIVLKQKTCNSSVVKIYEKDIFNKNGFEDYKKLEKYIWEFSPKFKIKINNKILNIFYQWINIVKFLLEDGVGNLVVDVNDDELLNGKS